MPRSHLHRAFLALSVLLVMMTGLAGAQIIPSPADTSRAAATDSAKAHADSLHAPADTSAKAAADSVIRLFLPLQIGSIDDRLDTSQVITRPAVQWLDYRSLADLLEYLPGFIIRNQYGAGQYTAPTIQGVDWRGIAVLSNGRTLSDPISGVVNPHLMAIDYLERIEVVTGPRAFLYGVNGTGATVNLVTRNYNSNRPFTRLSHSESGYGYSLTDGTFAQNISRRVGITAGFQFQGMDTRFPNSISDAWNFWGKLRFGLSEKLTLTLSEYYTSTNTDLNGGINPQTSYLPFDPKQSSAQNPDSYEKITRHDIDLSLVGAFLPDSADLSTLTFYSSNNLREYRDEENRTHYNPLLRSYVPGNGILKAADHKSTWLGVELTQYLTVGPSHLLLGGMVEARDVQRSPTVGSRNNTLMAAWAKDEVQIADLATIAAYGRMDSYLGNLEPGVGADARLTFTPVLTLFGGASVSHRLPSYTELSWADSTVARNGSIGSERHTVFEAGLEARASDESSLRFTLTHRYITDPILALPFNRPSVFPAITFTNGDRVKMTSADLSLSLRVWRLLFEGTGTYFLSRAGGTIAADLPRLWLNGGVYFRDSLFSGNLDLKAGFRGWYRPGFQGTLFNPEVVAYVPNTGAGLGRAATVDFVLVAHIGDAYIHLVWENLPDIAYYGTPYYPGFDREVRFGIGWNFWN